MRDNFSLALSHDTTVKNLDFLGVYQTSDLSTLKGDGLLGLGPSMEYENIPDMQGRVLVQQMKNSGLIDNAIFSVILGRLDSRDPFNILETESSIQFGGWNEQIVQDSMMNQNENDRGIKWFKPVSTYRWMVSLNSFKVGDLEIPKSGAS